MSQRSVEIVIGSLATDEAFRDRSREGAAGLLEGLTAGGHLELTRCERAALVETASDAWDRIAESVDPRLRKLNLSPD